jgi:hypothetical protein
MGTVTSVECHTGTGCRTECSNCKESLNELSSGRPSFHHLERVFSKTGTDFEDELIGENPTADIASKATLIAETLCALSDADTHDYQESWEQLRQEFRVQMDLWSKAGAKHEGIMASLKSKLEIASAINNAHNSNTILALEAVLRMNEAVEDLLIKRADERRKEMKFLGSTRERVQIANWASKAKLASPSLSSSTKRLTEDVMGQFQVRQARMDLAEYLLLVASLDDRRFERTQTWLDFTTKACDLRDPCLKECLSQVLIAEVAERKLRAFTGRCSEARPPSASWRIDPGRQVSFTMSTKGQPTSEEGSLKDIPTVSLPAWALTPTPAATTDHASVGGVRW